MSQDDFNVNAINIRVWAVKDGVHPDHEPKYLANAHFDDPSQGLGDVERVTSPDPNDFRKEKTIGQTKGTPERVTFSIMNRYTVNPALLMALARKQCSADYFAMIGKCGNPKDFYQGGEKFVYFPNADPTNIELQNFGAFGRDDSDPTDENMELSAEDWYEIQKLRFASLAEAEAVREILTINVCDDESCGDCGDGGSDGCSRILATMKGASATPGTQPVLLYSDDGGSTWSTQTIDTLFSNEDPSDAACIGGDFVVLSATAAEFHYTNVDDLYDGDNDWAQVDTGFLPTKAPLAMTHVGIDRIWVVGNGGYIYFSKNHKTGVVVQDAGIATTQNLLDVHAYDEDNVVAVGNNNAVVYTWNGGQTWESVTGPAVGENLGAVWMWSPDVWFIGTGAGGSGKLYYTVNGGKTWKEKVLPSAGITRIYDIRFVNEAEGYLIGAIGGKSIILRTLTGGYDWIVLPEGKTAKIPDNTYMTKLAVCGEGSNTVFGAGLADDGTAGFIVKAAGPKAWD